MERFGTPVMILRYSSEHPNATRSFIAAFANAGIESYMVDVPGKGAAITLTTNEYMYTKDGDYVCIDEQGRLGVCPGVAIGTFFTGVVPTIELDEGAEMYYCFRCAEKLLYSADGVFSVDPPAVKKMCDQCGNVRNGVDLAVPKFGSRHVAKKYESEKELLEALRGESNGMVILASARDKSTYWGMPL